MTSGCRLARTRAVLGEPLGDDASHLSGCARCREFVQREAELVALIRARRPRWPAPEALRDRVRERLFAESARAERGRPRPSRRRALSWAGALAGAAALAIVVARRERTGSERARELVELVATDHLAFATRGDDRFDVATASRGEVTEYVERRLARAPALPELPGARLAGARRCNLGGTPAALIFYEWSPTSGRSERVSLFVFASPGVELAELGRPVDLPGSPAVVAEQRGVAMVFWSDRGLTHAMAAAAPAPELTALLAAAR